MSGLDHEPHQNSSRQKHGVFDKGCLELARLCNEAVDYPRNGRRVEITAMPRRLFANKPDWKKGEVDAYGKRDFYRSDRAVGQSGSFGSTQD